MPAAPPSRTAIIGASGRMGSMLLERAAAAGLDVAGADLPYDGGKLAAACGAAEACILCVPARHLEEVVCAVSPHLPKGAILADITSVKEAPLRQMERHWQGPVVGTHPLFGPATQGDLPVALTPGKNAGAADTAKIAAFFEKLGCRAFETTAEAHDKAMARIQNLNFITNLAYFAALAGQEDLLPFLTPSFERRKEAARKMLNEDAEMFAGLFEANGHSHEAARQYRRALNLAASGDIDLLCRRAQWWWRDGKASGVEGDGR